MSEGLVYTNEDRQRLNDQYLQKQPHDRISMVELKKRFPRHIAAIEDGNLRMNIAYQGLLQELAESNDKLIKLDDAHRLLKLKHDSCEPIIRSQGSHTTELQHQIRMLEQRIAGANKDLKRYDAKKARDRKKPVAKKRKRK